MNIAIFTLLIGLDARCIHQKIRVIMPLFCLPLRPGNPGMTRRTLDNQSYKDPELVKVKMAIAHVRSGLRV